MTNTASTTRPRPVIGFIVSIAIALVSTQVEFALVFLAVFALERHDSSGGGGPFKSCTASSIECSGPNVPWAVVFAALALAIPLLAAATGAVITGRPRLARWVAFSVVNLVVIGAALVLFTPLGAVLFSR